MPNFWIQTPSDTALAEMQSWGRLGGNKYAAIRHHILVVPSSGGKGKAKNGPIHRQMEWPINAKFKMEDKITKVTSYTYSIQESITSAISSKLSQEILSKIGASASASLSKLEATLNSELQAKIGSELVESLQSSLSTTSTYAVETTRERSESLEFPVSPKDGSDATRPVFIYFKLCQLFWDVYLYRTDYLQLEYEKNWIWPNVRKTIVSREVNVRVPLFRVAYFEPVEAFSFRFDDYEPEIENGDSVTSLTVASKCPNASLQPKATMEELAKLAFPVSRRERDAAKKRKTQVSKPSAQAAGSREPTGARTGQMMAAAKSRSTKKVAAVKVGVKTSKATASKPRRGAAHAKRKV